jgi:hypothetical protein
MFIHQPLLIKKFIHQPLLLLNKFLHQPPAKALVVLLWHVYVETEYSSCWKCSGSGSDVCDLLERVQIFTRLPGESIDALFQWFTVVVNNMRANVDVLPYDNHDRAVKLLHLLDRTVWGGKFEAIVESEKYDTLTVNELFSKLKSAEVDQGMTSKIEELPDSHSLALIGGSK